MQLNSFIVHFLALVFICESSCASSGDSELGRVSSGWTIALQRRRIEAAEMKLLRPLAGYTLYDHKTNDYIRREHGLQAH